MQNIHLLDYVWKDDDVYLKGREHLGEQMPVMVYRLFQYALRDHLVERVGGDEMVDILRAAGRSAGTLYAQHMLDLSLGFHAFSAQLEQSFRIFKLGILQFEQFDLETNIGILTVSEDLDCSGLPVLGEMLCNYDEGFIAGILSEYTKKYYTVVEIDCWATGARICRFKAYVE